MIVFHAKNSRTPERGVALVVALLMLMLISAALMGMIMMSNTETNISSNFRDEQTAFFSSKGGIEEICKEVTCTGGVPTGSWYVTPAAAASASYAATPILPWKWVRVMAMINKPSTTSKLMPVNGSSGSDITAGYRVCWNGTNEVAISNIIYTSCPAANNTYLPVYELTALAVTSSGSRRMTQYE